jgi:hypothetical protein
MFQGFQMPDRLHQPSYQSIIALPTNDWTPKESVLGINQFNIVNENVIDQIFSFDRTFVQHDNTNLNFYNDLRRS